jgi:hypothetical protein
VVMAIVPGYPRNIGVRSIAVAFVILVTTAMAPGAASQGLLADSVAKFK